MWLPKPLRNGFLAMALVPFVSYANVSIDFQFQATLQSGSLAGIHFPGSASYSDQGFTGVGTEYVSLTSLDFMLLGLSVTLADIDQGGQAILQNGRLSYFTAAFFLLPATSPVDDIAFGFGGPGIIGYSTPPGFNAGSGTYEILASTPEPSGWVLCGTAFCLLLVLGRKRKRLLATEPHECE